MSELFMEHEQLFTGVGLLFVPILVGLVFYCLWICFGIVVSIFYFIKNMIIGKRLKVADKKKKQESQNKDLVK